MQLAVGMYVCLVVLSLLCQNIMGLEGKNSPSGTPALRVRSGFVYTGYICLPCAVEEHRHDALFFSVSRAASSTVVELGVLGTASALSFLLAYFLVDRPCLGRKGLLCAGGVITYVVNCVLGFASKHVVELYGRLLPVRLAWGLAAPLVLALAACGASWGPLLQLYILELVPPQAAVAAAALTASTASLLQYGAHILWPMVMCDIGYNAFLIAACLGSVSVVFLLGFAVDTLGESAAGITAKLTKNWLLWRVLGRPVKP